MRIIFVTDTHLAPALGEFTANWSAARNFARRSGADLTVHLGDMSMDGIDTPEQLDFVHASTRDWPTPLFFVPGNHDVGDNPPGPDIDAEQPFDPARLAHYRQLFGPDYWLRTIGAWRLLGLNAQLFGSGTLPEQEQWQWLESVLQAHGNHPTVLCLHKPLFRDDPADPRPHIRYVPLAQRQRLLSLLAPLNVRLIVSGHTHQYLDRVLHGVRHIWLPSTAFYIPDHYQERVGEKITGLGVLTCTDDRYEFDLVNPDGVVRHNIANFAIYPLQNGMSTE